MGDVISAELILWPKEEITENDLKSLESSFLGKNSIYIGSVNEIGESPNNEQALVARLVLVPTAAADWRQIQTIKIKGISYPLQMTGVSVQAFEKISDKFISIEQELPSGQRWKWIAASSSLAFLLTLVFLLPWMKRKRKAQKLAQQEKLEKKKWLEYLKSAKSRSDYENLYSHRSAWVKDNWSHDPDVMKFFESLHVHQYKREWSQEEKSEVDNLFEKIRGKLDE